MVKTTSLSEDINFVKEFEELRLKQKLLIESLNKKNSSQLNGYLLDINSKLDFLVKIFKEVNIHEGENDTTTLITSKFLELTEKVENIDKNFNEKISLIEETLNNLNIKLNKTGDIVEKIESEEKSMPPAPEFKIDEKKIDSINAESKDNQSVQLFREANVEENSKKEVKSEEIKKKKWF